MAMRAQCSLLFEDSELYENFVLPMKAQRELNNIIIRCLSVYYHSDDIRESINNFGTEVEDEEPVSSEQDIINNIRSTLALQSFCVTELENTISDGMESVGDILNESSDIMEEQSFVTPKDNDNFSSGVPLLQLKTQEEAETIKENIKEKQQSKSNVSNSALEQLLFRVADKVGVDYSDLFNIADTVSSTSKQDTVVEEKVEPIQLDEGEDIISTDEESKVEESVVENVEEDASNSMMDLLESLNF